MDEQKWMEERKIKFSMASEKDIPELRKFIQESFLPDEPVSRNTKVMLGDGRVDLWYRNEMTKYLVDIPISKIEIAPASIIARSTEDNSIMACRMGQMVSRVNGKDEPLPPIGWLGGLPLWIPIPKKIIDMVNNLKLFEDTNYGKLAAFTDLKDAERIYFAANICVASKARGLGLGSELVKRGYDIAKKHGCQYTYILASSLYSQIIFHKLGNCSVLHEVKYEDYKYDKRGREYIIDPREHKVAQVLAISHEPKN